MFNLLKNKKKKKINTQEIKSFNSAIKTIEDFIYVKDFDKARRGIKEIIKKEKESFLKYGNNLNSKEKKKETNILNKKIKKLDKLKIKLEIESDLYNKYKDKNNIEYLKKNIKRKIKEACNIDDIGKINSQIREIEVRYKDNINVLYFVNKIKNITHKKLNLIKKNESKKIKNNTLLEAKLLTGELEDEKIINELKVNNNSFSFKELIKNRFRLIRLIKEKKVLNEIEIILEQERIEKEIYIKGMLQNVHSGLIKGFEKSLNGYEIYSKILGADKITGDTVGFYEGKKDYRFFIGDATGHGIKAGFIVSKMTNNFYNYAKYLDFKKMAININNNLKQKLTSGNFITSILFSINKTNPDYVNIIGMGHEQIFIYRKNKKIVEKIIPGGLAGGIRLIKDSSSIKSKEVFLEDGDVLVSYTDGIIEEKDEKGEMYGDERLSKVILEVCKNKPITSKDVYNGILNNLKYYLGGRTKFKDDLTILILKRDTKKEQINNTDKIINILKDNGIEAGKVNRYKGKSIDYIEKNIKKIKKEKELKNIIKKLELINKSGEYTDLKKECIKYIKEGYIHKSLNKLLKKAIEKENKFKIKQKNIKIENKYKLLEELYKRGEYSAVIKECSHIIEKEGNI